MSDITAADLERLADWDTPTICNGLEALDPAYRLSGYTTKAFTCMRPEQKPIVGYARTATIRASAKPALPPDQVLALRQSYYEYVDRGGEKPSVIVIQDLDSGPARGAMRLFQIPAEPLDAGTRFGQGLVRGGIRCPEVRAQPKGCPMHHSDALSFQQLGDEILVILDHLA